MSRGSGDMVNLRPMPAMAHDKFMCVRLDFFSRNGVLQGTRELAALSLAE